MKLLVAMIRPERLEAVQETLHEPGVCLLAVSWAADPREPCARERYRGLEVRLPRPRLRIEVVVVNEALVDWAVGAIARAGSSREPVLQGDGDILVIPVDDHVRISAQPREEPASDDMAPAGTSPPFDLRRLRP
jgi:nitrogen regulatory protein P-II 1